MTRDLALTWCSGDSLKDAGFKCYLNSLKQAVPNCQKLVFGDSFDDSSKELISSYGAECIDVALEGPLFKERYYEFWKHTVTWRCWAYRYFMHADARDVIFQDDPFRYVAELEPWLFLVSEGITHQQCVWNCHEQMRVQQELQAHAAAFGDWPVVNGGTQIGRADEMINYFFLIWSNSLRSKYATDQGTHSYLYQFLKHDPRVALCEPATNLLCLTGHGVELGAVQYQWLDGKFCNMNGVPYCIVHQWDRTPHKNEVLEKYSV